MATDLDDSIGDENGVDTEIWQLMVRAIQNALIYGYRVRFLHSMAYQMATFKLESGVGGLVAKIWKSVRLGIDHGKVLACFAVVYRGVTALLKRLRRHRHKGDGYDRAIEFGAGFAGGVLIYSGLLRRHLARTKQRRSAVLNTLLDLNEGILAQITMYTMSRVVFAYGRDLAELLVAQREPDERHRKPMVKHVSEVSWIVTCGVVWGSIMVYYNRDRDTSRRRGPDGSSNGSMFLPKALRISLEFIYGGARHAWKEAFDYNTR